VSGLHSILCTLSGIAALIVCCGMATAEPFPARPVTIVVPYPISGPTDIRGTSRMSRSYRLMAPHAPPAITDTLARIVQQAIRADTPHAVALLRQPGGATTRGAMSVARATADGHTLLLASNATIIINPHYFHGIEYDPVRDFVLVAPLATMPFVLMVNAGLPMDDVRGLAAWLKVRPGEVNFGSSGDGSTGHLAGELFRRMAGVSLVHVSYDSGVNALTGLATRQVSLMFAALPLTLIYYPSEHFRPLAVTSSRRLERLPEVPTIAESGFPDYEIEAWYGLFAPVGSPPVAAAWLRSQISALYGSTAIRSHLRGLGLEPASMTLEQFATRINSEIDRWAPLLRASRLPLKAVRSE
jgi:tripartite-type tricarboxylate transporter receptor subunit TctC